jgi:type VI protein secretion system component VasK
MGSSDHAILRFDANGHSVTYEIRASSAFTPITLRDLAEFRCPRL